MTLTTTVQIFSIIKTTTTVKKLVYSCRHDFYFIFTVVVVFTVVIVTNVRFVLSYDFSGSTTKGTDIGLGEVGLVISSHDSTAMIGLSYDIHLNSVRHTHDGRRKLYRRPVAYTLCEKAYG